MDVDIAVLAGGVSTVIFTCSVMPMVVKAVRTRDLTSYSLGNLLLSNVGNLIHSVYIYSLPAGPIWALHAFYLVTTAFMLAMYVRHALLTGRRLHHLPHADAVRTQLLPDAGRTLEFLQSNQSGTSP